MTNENEVVERTCVGDHQPHGSDAQALESFALTLEIRHRVLLTDIVSLEEAVYFIAGLKTEKPPQIRLMDMSEPVHLRKQRLERAPRQIAGEGAEPAGDVVWDVDGQLDGNGTVLMLRE